jgi:hypothetical protein
LTHDLKRLETATKDLTKRLLGKEGATASGIWKLMHEADASAVLWLAHTGKNTAIQNRFKSFFTARAEARQKLPHALMQEMRIVPTLPIYAELMERMTTELMDGKLATPEAQKTWLEPHSPPPPPTPVSLRRPRPVKKAAKKVKAPKPVVAAAVAPAAVAAPVAAKAAPAKAIAAAKPVAAPVKTVAKVAAKAAPVKTAAKPVAKKVAAKAVKKAVKKPAAKPVKKSAKKPAAKPVKKSAKKAAKKKR